MLSLCLGFVALFWLAFGFLTLAELSTNKYLTPTSRLLLFGLVGISWLNVIIDVARLRRSLKHPLAIFKSGIEVQGVKIPWSEVEWCRWGRYVPKNLEVQTHRLRLYFPIPRDQRATVEAALRDSGKWQC